MHYVRAEAVRWVDDEWPGWAEVHFRESDGNVGSLVDTMPIFDAGDRLTPGTPLPVDVTAPCEVIERAEDPADSRSSLVRLRSNIEDQRGRTTFHVDEHTLVSDC